MIFCFLHMFNDQWIFLLLLKEFDGQLLMWQMKKMYMKSLKRRTIYRKQEIEKVRRTIADRIESNHRFVCVFGNSEVVHWFLFTLRVVVLCVGWIFVRCEMYKWQYVGITFGRWPWWSLKSPSDRFGRSLQIPLDASEWKNNMRGQFFPVYIRCLSNLFIFFFFAFSYTNILRINYLLFVSFNNEINDFYFVFISATHVARFLFGRVNV